MAKRVVPFAFTPGRPDLMQGVEVFVRAHLTGSTTWSGDTADRVHEVVLPATFLHPEIGQRAVVDRRDIVAMVADDRADRYAWSREFTPEGGYRESMEATAGGRTASMTIVADAHVEPIGEPRFTVAHFGIPLIAAPAWWVVDAAASPPVIMNGPFPEQHLAQAEADDLNQEDSAR